MEVPQGKLDGLQKNKAKIEKELLKETDKLENERKKYDCEIVHETIHVPASNAAVESLYSHVTEIKNFKRSKLSSKNLDDILALFYSDLYMENPLTNFVKSNVNK